MVMGLENKFYKNIILTLLILSANSAQEVQNLSNNQIPDLIDAVGSAIVMILAEGDNYKDKTQGSGVIVNNGNFVITNAHVVTGARKVTIKFLDGSKQTVYGYSSED